MDEEENMPALASPAVGSSSGRSARQWRLGGLKVTKNDSNDLLRLTCDWCHQTFIIGKNALLIDEQATLDIMREAGFRVPDCPAEEKNQDPEDWVDPVQGGSASEGVPPRENRTGLERSLATARRVKRELLKRPERHWRCLACDHLNQYPLSAADQGG